MPCRSICMGPKWTQEEREVCLTAKSLIKVRVLKHYDDDDDSEMIRLECTDIVVEQPEPMLLSRRCRGWAASHRLASCHQYQQQQQQQTWCLLVSEPRQDAAIRPRYTSYIHCTCNLAPICRVGLGLNCVVQGACTPRRSSHIQIARHNFNNLSRLWFHHRTQAAQLSQRNRATFCALCKCSYARWGATRQAHYGRWSFAKFSPGNWKGVSTEAPNIKKIICRCCSD